MDSEDGELFIKQLANFVRTHEKALANALQFRRQITPRHGSSHSVSSVSTVALASSPTLPERPSTAAATPNGLAAAFSLGALGLTSHTAKSTKLALTPHHLFYLLSRFAELGIPVGPMKVRLENLHDTATSANYVSFLSQSHRSQTGGSDVGSIRSVSSMRSVVSGMSSLWSSFGIGASISAARNEKQKAQIQADLTYLYSSFTKIPCLKLAPDWRARLIRGYEEFPFDSAVPLYIFKNVQALEVSDIDFRQFFGWDRMADQLRSLTLKRASVEDPVDFLIDIVLDDMDRRRRRTSKTQISPTTNSAWPPSPSPRRSPTIPQSDTRDHTSGPATPAPRYSAGDLPVGSMNSEYSMDQAANMRDRRRRSVARVETDGLPTRQSRARSHSHSPSPRRPVSSRNNTYTTRGGYRLRRSGSGSSQSSLSDSWPHGRGSFSNLGPMGILPASKWRFLRHLSLTDNALTTLAAPSLAPLSNTLHSLDLSTNLFTQIPDSVATLTALRALNLAQCMIDSLHSLNRNPLPAITALNLRSNRLQSLAGIEKLYPLERLDLRDNHLTDPMELTRLTGIPDIREIWVEGNPFVRTHKNYRTTIFNLFRRTPGYLEDITIDATLPTYSEKRHLVERAAVPPAVPVVKPPADETLAVDISKLTIMQEAPLKEPAVLRKERSTPKSSSPEVNTPSSRRSRPSKRRIVDLATHDKPMPHAQPVKSSIAHADLSLLQDAKDANYAVTSVPGPSRASTSTLIDVTPSAEARPAIPRIDTSVIPPLAPLYASPTQSLFRDSPDWGVGTDAYRQKVEAIRSKIGKSYLSVVNEGWDPNSVPHQHEQDFTTTGPLSSQAAVARAASSQAISSGRTIGSILP